MFWSSEHGLSRKYVLHEKCPYSEFFWTVFSRSRTEYGVSLRIQSYCGKIQPKKNSQYEHVLRTDDFAHFLSEAVSQKQFIISIITITVIISIILKYFNELNQLNLLHFY